MENAARVRFIARGFPGKWPTLDDNLGIVDGSEWIDYAGHSEDAVPYPYLVCSDGLSSGTSPGQPPHQFIRADQLVPERWGIRDLGIPGADLAGDATEIG